MVKLWCRSTSCQPDVVRVVTRALDVDDAIRSLMQSRDLGYVSVALAYPTDKDMENIGPENWRRRAKCRISGKYSCVKDDSWQGSVLV